MTSSNVDVVCFKCLFATGVYPFEKTQNKYLDNRAMVISISLTGAS